MGNAYPRIRYDGGGVIFIVFNGDDYFAALRSIFCRVADDVGKDLGDPVGVGPHGQRAWRLLHYVTFLAFAGATIHGITTGSDSGQAWAFWIYLVPLTSAVFLITYRIVISVATHLSGTQTVATAPVARGPDDSAPRRLVPTESDLPSVQPRRLAGLFD